MITKATVIGTGAMGTVMAQILATNGVRVALLARNSRRVQQLVTDRQNKRYLEGLRLSPNITPTDDATAAFRNTELIIAAMPTQFLRQSLEQIGAALPNDVPICSVAKGIEVKTGNLPSELIADFAPKAPHAVLSGPSIAAELAKCLPATVVVACADQQVAAMLQGVLSTTWFRVYTNDDVVGVELSGALKNVIAIAAGILDGLHAGDNAKAALITRGLVELARLGIALGGKPETVYGLAGVGDLITTCVSPHGRNRTAGQKIGEGIGIDDVVASSKGVIEGIPTTRAVLALAKEKQIELPITEAVARVLFEGVAPLDAISDLMQRPQRSEGVY